MTKKFSKNLGGEVERNPTPPNELEGSQTHANSQTGSEAIKF